MPKIPMTHVSFNVTLLATLALGLFSADQPVRDADPLGVLLKPIPDRLVVLTFDDAPASHATIVAPILKSLGFGATIYVCDFDSFRTRKDWYLTWRQMQAMDRAGLEIGNHTVGHGSGLENFLRMEDELAANNVPKPTTVCWPIYHVAWSIIPDLTKHGYTFGRGGHSRAYRPTVDHPFDVPSQSIQDNVSMEKFIGYVQQAINGRIVVLTFHGVPDMEHPPVSLDPATFKSMMQYLKDNNYQCVAMRDLAQYIDVTKALQLPKTVSEVKDAGPTLSLKDVKPYVANGNSILSFIFGGLTNAKISGTNITATVPYDTDLTALKPGCTISTGASVIPASGTARDFSTPQRYTVTSGDGSTKAYTVTVKKIAVSPAKDFQSFVLPGSASVAISGNSVGVNVPAGTDVKMLAPTFSLSPFAKAVPASGSARDFSQPQSYTITAQDGTSRVYTVTVVTGAAPAAFTWKGTAGGKWSEVANWSSSLAAGSAPATAGGADYILHFNQGGAVTNDLKPGFLLNQLFLGDGCRGMKLSGSNLVFTKNPANGFPPAIKAGKCGSIDVNVPLTLHANLSVNTSFEKDPNCFINLNQPITGSGALILNSSGDPDVPGINFHDMHFGILQINQANTYSGGTLINGGKINVRKSEGLGTGPVTLDNFATLSCEGTLANPLIINRGTLFHCAASGPITLNGTAQCISNCTLSGAISGAGGLTMLGTNGTYLNMVPGGTLTLLGANTYTGPTTVFPGVLTVKKAAGLYNADATKWTPTNITVHQAAMLRLSVGGPEEFSGAQISTLLANLTNNISNNGLMGGSSLCLDTTNATEAITISATIADSKGLGGGAFVMKKFGGATLHLSGKNTYTGQTIVESGALSVSSINNVIGGKPSSSLGAPADVEAGEIVFGEDGKDGECTLIYTGTGETTDRVFNFFGKKATVTFDQSGSGVLKLSSSFLIFGTNSDKTIVLTGSTVGTGEVAGVIENPHSRNGKATTSLIKSGSGNWTLSGANRYTGSTRIEAGTLICTHASALGHGALAIAGGAKLQLNHGGTCLVTSLTINGEVQPPGTYGSKASPATNTIDTCFMGTGTVTVRAAVR